MDKIKDLLDKIEKVDEILRLIKEHNDMSSYDQYISIRDKYVDELNKIRKEIKK